MDSEIEESFEVMPPQKAQTKYIHLFIFLHAFVYPAINAALLFCNKYLLCN